MWDCATIHGFIIFSNRIKKQGFIKLILEADLLNVLEGPDIKTHTHAVVLHNAAA